MSLSNSLIKSINDIVETYMDRIVTKYNLNKNELQKLWTGSDNIVSNVKKSSSIDVDDISEERLLKCNKAELVSLCKSHNYKCTGTKAVLTARLLGKPEEKSTKKSTTKKSTKTSKKVESNSAIIKKLTADIPTIPIRRNQFNNHEHPETGLVFDKKTKMVIGKQNDDGSLLDLTSDDIENCKKYKFRYTIPENLNQNNLDDVKVEELDVSDDEEEESDVSDISEEESETIESVEEDIIIEDEDDDDVEILVDDD